MKNLQRWSTAISAIARKRAKLAVEEAREKRIWLISRKISASSRTVKEISMSLAKTRTYRMPVHMFYSTTRNVLSWALCRRHFIKIFAQNKTQTILINQWRGRRIGLTNIIWSQRRSASRRSRRIIFPPQWWARLTPWSKQELMNSLKPKRVNALMRVVPFQNFQSQQSQKHRAPPKMLFIKSKDPKWQSWNQRARSR